MADSLFDCGWRLIFLLYEAIRQAVNQNLPIGILSGLSTIASGFVTTIFSRIMIKRMRE